MSEISKFHPYNVLWAQLGDLYGANGNPPKLSKTIICGAHAMIIKKLLNVLTYFIRCGDIKRVKSSKVLEKGRIDEIISQKTYQEKVNLSNSRNEVKTLSRTKTCLKEISNMAINDELSMKIELPNHFVGVNSALMHQNAGIEIKNQPCTSEMRYESPNSPIKLMLTTPDNDQFECEAAAEAIDFVLKKMDSVAVEVIVDDGFVANKSDENSRTSCSSLWNMETVKDGISIQKWQNYKNYFQKTNNFAVKKTEVVSLKTSELKRSFSLNLNSNRKNRKIRNHRMIVANKQNIDVSDNGQYIEENPVLSSTASLSDLLSDISIGSSERLQKTIETELVMKEINLQQEMHFEKSKKCVDKQNNLTRSTGSVVFVLGDNEVLSGLKTPSLTPLASTTPSNSENDIAAITKEPAPNPAILETTKPSHILNENNKPLASTASSINATKQEKKKKHCTHKKHSGVKFNFEQYPQIVTNYMKNKNLDISSYDFLEKGLKLEQENAFKYGTSSTNALPMFMPEDIPEQDEQKEEEEECECCANTFRILQTPSNATELEFSNDDGSYPVPISTPTKSNQVDEKSANSNENQICDNSGKSIDTSASESDEDCSKAKDTKQKWESAKCMELVSLPIAKTEFLLDAKDHSRIRPGFVPSLFIGITDHFISDMVLQVGTHSIVFSFHYLITLKQFFLSTFQ